MKALCVPASVVNPLVRAAVPLVSSVAIVALICAPVSMVFRYRACHSRHSKFLASSGSPWPL